ncbi:MAG: hypothetical protein ACP59X_04270 [Solidesulfovibrio sp. DCME]|uniref:hypothetical protein n=1 Tax=Solidesulfovibrio sp. DCME TaxID=3447380 RepID=UPI003D1370C6
MATDTKAAAVDILADLLCAPPPKAPSDRDPEAFPHQRALARLVRRLAEPQASPPRRESQPAKPEPLAAVPPAAAKRKAAKRKATHYVAPATALRLDQAKAALSAAAQGRVSKSAIVEAALTLALDGLEAAGGHSPLARRLASPGDAGGAPRRAPVEDPS